MQQQQIGTVLSTGFRTAALQRDQQIVEAVAIDILAVQQFTHNQIAQAGTAGNALCLALPVVEGTANEVRVSGRFRANRWRQGGIGNQAAADGIPRLQTRRVRLNPVALRNHHALRQAGHGHGRV